MPHSDHPRDEQGALSMAEHRQAFQRELEAIESKIIELFGLVA